MPRSAGSASSSKQGWATSTIEAGRFAREWGIEQPVGLLADLARAGVRPEEIDLVILTHLHFDHCGGNTRRDGSGRVVPTFPRARHFVQRREYAEARYPGPLSKNSYFAENLMPVEEAGLWELLDGDVEIMPGVSVAVAPGHVPALQMVRFESQGQVALAVTDLIPSALHLRPAWNTAYDLDPQANAVTSSASSRRRRRAAWHLFFYHDTDLLLGRVETIAPSPRSWPRADARRGRRPRATLGSPALRAERPLRVRSGHAGGGTPGAASG